MSTLAVVLGSTGSILVLSSMYRLGITGTYLGDVFHVPAIPLIPVQVIISAS
jgi:hypothetical protein